MLPTLPRALPDWPALLEDLGQPQPAQLARWLDVTQRTLQRWAASGCAPRPAVLALWWCSSWARNEAVSRAEYGQLLAVQLVDSLQRENRALLATVDRLAPLARAGAANEPLRPAWAPGEHFQRPDLGPHPAGRLPARFDPDIDDIHPDPRRA